VSIGTPSEIRLAVVAALTGQTDADARVRDAEPLPLDAQSLKAGPWLSVWTPKRRSVPMGGPRRLYTVSVDILIQGVLSGPDGPTTVSRLDTLESQVRDVLLSGTWADQWTKIEAVECDNGVDPRDPSVGSFDLTIRVAHDQQYVPTPPDPSGQIHHVTTEPVNTDAEDTEQIIVVSTPPAPAP